MNLEAKKGTLRLSDAWTRRLALMAEGNKLWAEGNKLWAEGNKLWAEGGKLWIDAVEEAYGNNKIFWVWRAGKLDHACILENGEVYEP